MSESAMAENHVAFSLYSSKAFSLIHKLVVLKALDRLQGGLSSKSTEGVLNLSEVVIGSH